MKTFRSSLIAMSFVVATACNEDSDPVTASSSISTEEAAEMVAISLAKDASGMTEVVADAASTADNAMEEVSGGRSNSCGYSKNINLSKSNPAGTLITYSYEYNYSYQMECSSEETPMSLLSSVSYSGWFDAPRLASQQTGLGDLSVSALDSTTIYLVNGSYTSSGEFQSKIGNKNSHTGSVEILIDEVTVDKSSKEIASGTASVSVKGEVPGKGGYSFSGSIVFNGKGNASLTIDGETYTIDTESGEVE